MVNRVRKEMNGKPMAKMHRLLIARRRRDQLPWQLFKFWREEIPLIGKTGVMCSDRGGRHRMALKPDLFDWDPMFKEHSEMYAWAKFDPETQYFEFDKSRDWIYAPYPEDMEPW